VTPALQFRNISKSFFGVKVLKDISFAVAAGQTLGIVGENGAGKSTLMNILGGNLPSDTGAMELDGQRYAPSTPRDAEHAGIAFVHQELNLFSNLSIAENLCLASFPRRTPWLPWINRRQMRERTRQWLAEVHLAHTPDTLVERLSAGERQLVEIAKALATRARLIILDEPTTSLTSVEAERLFAIMGKLRQRGISLIYISHSLGDVLRLCDDVVVLRDGAVVAQAPARELTVERMIALMVGREITRLFPPRTSQPTDRVLLEVREVAQPGVLKPLSFQLHAGEILGLSGLMGAGRSELARILFGLDPCTTGDLRLNGESLRGLSPRQRIRRGLAFLTEDRRFDGLCPEASIDHNLTLVALPSLTRSPLGWVDRTKTQQAIDSIREAVRLTSTAENTQPVKTLSGGNQQKVVLAKWLLNQPKVFILDEPTRGIDVGAKYEVYRLVQSLAGRGTGVLLISSEVEELIGLCDRILVLRRGEIRDSVEPASFDRERILRAALHEEVRP